MSTHFYTTDLDVVGRTMHFVVRISVTRLGDSHRLVYLRFPGTEITAMTRRLGRTLVGGGIKNGGKIKQ